MTMITFVAVLIFGGDGLSAQGSRVLKITDVSWYMVVYQLVIVLYM